MDTDEQAMDAPLVPRTRSRTHVDFDYGDQGRASHEQGKPCEPPEDLHLIAALSWVSGWLDAADEALANADTEDSSSESP